MWINPVACANAVAISEFLCQVSESKPQDDNAERVYRWALELDPENAEALNGLGRCAMAKGQMAQAIECFDEAIDTANSAAFYLNRGIAEMRTGDEGAAIADCREAIRLHPEGTRAHVTLGEIYYERGEYDTFDEIINEGLRLQPLSGKLHCARAISRFLKREWLGAWEDWEYRDSVIAMRNTLRGHREWMGENLRGKTLLVVGEHGIGDEIMFARWLPEIPGGNRVLFYTGRETLNRIVAPFADAVIADDTELRKYDFDYWVALSSLPLRTGVVEPPAPLRLGRPGITTSRNLRVGISWHGDARTSVEWKRPVDFERWWKPLLDIPGIDWYSLQCDERPCNLPPCWGDDIYATGRCIETLDLVVTADTMIAHLAASCGIPTWMLIYKIPEWRWPKDGESSEWYPADVMRIIRQPERGDWDSVFAQAKGELEAMVGQLCR